MSGRLLRVSWWAFADARGEACRGRPLFVLGDLAVAGARNIEPDKDQEAGERSRRGVYPSVDGRGNARLGEGRVGKD